MTDITKLGADELYAEKMEKIIHNQANEDGSPLVVEGAYARLLNVWKAEVRKARLENGELHQENVKLKRKISRLEFIDNMRGRLIETSRHVILVQKRIIDLARQVGQAQSEYEIAIDKWHESNNAQVLPKVED